MFFQTLYGGNFFKIEFSFFISNDAPTQETFHFFLHKTSSTY